MLLLVFLLQIIKVLSNTKTGIEPRIVGGQLAEIKDFPYAVLFINDNHICGGSILNMKIILTAAHCLDKTDKSKMLVRGGTKMIFDKNAQDFNVQEYIIHEEYNAKINFQCDIGLLLLKQSIVYNQSMQKAKLATHDKWRSPSETNFIVAGWGTIWYGGPSKMTLMYASLRFIDSDICRKLNRITLSPDMFCLYGDGERDTCQGDSGGGVIWKGAIVGLVSFGEGCAVKNKPAMYANVFYFRKWINNTVQHLQNMYCKSLVLRQNVKN